MADRSKLFRGVDGGALDAYLKNLGAYERKVAAGEYVFREEDEATGLFILLDGVVEVEKNDYSGKRQMVNRFDKPETVFGEVYLFLEDRPYDFACRAVKDSRLLFVPKEAFDLAGGATAQRLTENMLQVLAKKAYFLNQKLLILSAGSLRKKIARHLLFKNPEGEPMTLMNREELADYLAVPRPSLSRELMKMHREGYIDLKGRELSFDPEKLESLLF
ncbi:Crp/Fnr family transcriptional regulator [Aedoeadaptatus urinae]|uniref:Crp/Fnr family transcriptional regulator n=1 Tax=Aedoeadaptatus urinae TaxID=1871017 RepID=UPI0013566203|nr:Crp/Fnr family transcriptional regulator [Peptoniphilus urinae]